MCSTPAARLLAAAARRTRHRTGPRPQEGTRMNDLLDAHEIHRRARDGGPGEAVARPPEQLCVLPGDR